MVKLWRSILQTRLRRLHTRLITDQLVLDCTGASGPNRNFSSNSWISLPALPHLASFPAASTGVRSPQALLLSPVSSLISSQRRNHRLHHPPSQDPDIPDSASRGRSTAQLSSSIEFLSKNRRWVTLAGFDPKASARNGLVWETYMGYARTAYHDADFDLRTTWGAQSVSKKEKAMAELGRMVAQDRDLKEFEGLEERDLMGWKFGRMHSGLRNYLRSLGETQGPPTTSKVVEARREKAKWAAKESKDRARKGTPSAEIQRKWVWSEKSRVQARARQAAENVQDG